MAPMIWTYCRNCLKEIQTQSDAVQIFIKRRGRDPHDLSSKKFNFEFCNACHEILLEKFECFKTQEEIPKNKRDEKIKEKIGDVLCEFLYGEGNRDGDHIANPDALIKNLLKLYKGLQRTKL